MVWCCGLFVWGVLVFSDSVWDFALFLLSLWLCFFLSKLKKAAAAAREEQEAKFRRKRL